MNAKKILLKAARTPKQKEEVKRLSEAEAADLLRNLTNKEDKNAEQSKHHGSPDPRS